MKLISSLFIVTVTLTYALGAVANPVAATVCAARTDSSHFSLVYGAAWPAGQGPATDAGTNVSTTAAAVVNSANTGGTYVEMHYRDYSSLDNEGGVDALTRAQRARTR